MTCGVYEFWCGPYFYQGSSVDMEYRLRKHREALKRGNHDNPKMQNVFNQHGMQDERFLVVCEDGLQVRYEQDYIDANWGDPYYINLDPLAQCGGGMRGKTHSEETKVKMRAAALGRKHTDEHRAKNAAARMGKKLGPQSDEHKARIGAANRLRAAERRAAKAVTVAALDFD